MKTLEELEEMTVEQLKGIATGLGAEPKANIRKPELVQMVYDIQQPEAPEQDGDEETAPQEPKTINTREEFDAQLDAIAKHFGEAVEVIEVGENDEGVTLYAVVDELTDQELAKGTFLELYDQVTAFDPENPPALDVPEEQVPHAPPAVEPVNTETPALDSDEEFARIKEGLVPLSGLGLKYTVNGSVIKFSVGSKSVTTTLNQPAHRVVQTAKTLCNFR